MLFERMKDVIAKWEPLREQLLEAIECTHGTHTEDDVLAMILAGKLTLWSNGNAIMVTEFSDYPRMRVVNVFICAGDYDKMWEVEKMVIDDAKTNGCKRITGAGRKGWTKVLPGYEPGGYFMHKDF